MSRSMDDMELTMGTIGLRHVGCARLDSSRRMLSKAARWSAIVVIAGLLGCGDDSPASSSDAPATSATLKSLTAKQLTGLCQQLLPKVRSASTPTHECTLSAVQDTNDEDSCAVAKADCVKNKAYDDWSKAACATFAADAGTTPSFDCSTKVSSVLDCFDASAKWLNALTCKAADPAANIEDPPTCLEELQTGACAFDLDLLLKDTNFHATKPDGGIKPDAGTVDPSKFYCADGKDKYDYDLGSGDACNVCATDTKTGCCDTWVGCLKDTACACFVDCADEDDVCFAKCKITDYPDIFIDHANCVGDQCGRECGFQ
jgi:hypothetical protein